MEMEEKEMKVYEFAFNLVPSLEEGDLAAEFGNLKDDLVKAGAQIISEQYPRPLELSYEMSKIINNKKEKFKSAFFGWIKFEINSDKIEEIEKKAKRNDKIIRHMLIKTVRENTLAPKKTQVVRGEGRPAKGASKEEGEIDKEVIDQKIEELVV